MTQATMTSAEMNEALHNLEEEPLFETGKAVPYIGWFWRDVDFDAETYSFGICRSTGTAINGMILEDPSTFVGFMENNKWDYAYTRDTTPEEWWNIKSLIASYLTSKSLDDAKAVWNAIQAINN